MRQLLCALLLAGLAACSDNASKQVQTGPPAVAKTSVDSVPATTSITQLTPQAVKLADIPAKLRLPGQLLEAWRWTDANGENLLVVFKQEQEQANTAGQAGEAYQELPDQSVELFARQYVQRDGDYKELWRLQDAVRHCNFDIWLGPLSGATSITDLDHDGQSETTLIYKLTCRSDVSPSNLKLVMREGPAKYALRGYTVVQYDSVPAAQRIPASSCCLDTIRPARLEKYYGLLHGRYETEQEFRQAPPAFLRFARQQWRHWCVEREFEQL
ncbi:M949_RS01915 family surface polysaccharide biosynthesis protein [Hymenobacter metallilatus]|uniref:Lipoprotein n=1 Tax=Hymenobacter metallilatus TaxID=2493666 RepID=A0A3R9LX65_9BACT|nr:hypothetical protein [Hymenobacter metallilatus]RSK30197.1 hypothetical protein EI290_15200 [Hymenobacter metallilatus]